MPPRKQPSGAHGDVVSLPPPEIVGFLGRLRAILTGDSFVNLTVVLALAVGFFHGWLKLKIRSPFTTFAFDFVVIIALVVVFLRAGTFRRFFPEGPTANALFAFYGLCLAYMPLSLLPGMPPFVVALSTLRGWIFASFLYGLGYQIIRSRSQVHGYFLVILLLGVVTAIYGIRQSDSEVLQMMQEDPYFARRYRGQGYVDAEGDYHVRRFSTFISSGAFGASMATLVIFGSALFLAPGTRKVEKVILAALMVPIGYGMLLSGARSAAITAALGVLVLLLARRQVMTSLAIILVAGLGTFLAFQATGGGVFDRLGTLNFTNLFYRFWWPTEMGLRFMVDHPLGGGIGKTGFRPAFLRGVDEYDDYLAPDGDLGRLMVEFGVLGLIFFGRIAYHAARRMFQVTRDTLSTDSGSLVLASATNLWISIAFLGVGSPFIGIPMGVLVWFFVGAAERLHAIELAERRPVPTVAESPPETPLLAGPVTDSPEVLASAARARRRFLYATPERTAATPATPATPAIPNPAPATKTAGGDGAPPGSVVSVEKAPADAEETSRNRRSRKVFLYGPPRKSAGQRPSPGDGGSSTVG